MKRNNIILDIQDVTVSFDGFKALNSLSLKVKKNQMIAFRHKGFWQCMDTLRDRNTLENLWEKGNAPWKSW